MQSRRKNGVIKLLVAGVALPALMVAGLGLMTLNTRAAETAIPRMPSDHLLFTTSSHCIACHSQVHAHDGEDISIGFQWRASVMANSSRDPYWQASIRRETIDHATAKAAIEDKCSTCHMPMQRYQAQAEGLRGEVFAYLAAVRAGAAKDEPDGVLENAKNVKATLAADGVSCTVCHQITPGNMHDESSLDGGFLIDVTKKDDDRDIFGPFDTPDQGRTRIMNTATGFVPQKADYLGDSALCASCHTLFTAALDDKGQPAGTLPEQVPYQEWLHSSYRDRQSCQDCHMTEVAGPQPITSVHAQDHQGVMRHIFVGGNAFLLAVLKKHGDELGVSALPEELDASVRCSEMLLAEKSASLTIGDPHLSAGRLQFVVHLSNETGHKLPTAYPARRAWLHVSIKDAAGRLVFESGAVRPDGSIVGNPNDADPQKYEPHHSRITEPGQVEIYESIMGDYAGRVTTGLLYGTHYLKDNRLLPRGFDKTTADPLVAVVGGAKDDPAFQGGSDDVTFDISVPGGAAPYTISAELLYESIGYRWAQNLAPYRTDETSRFLSYYDELASTAAKLVARAPALSVHD